MHSLWERKIAKPLVDLLALGMTPEQIALSVALGVVLGLFRAAVLRRPLGRLGAARWIIKIRNQKAECPTNTPRNLPSQVQPAALI
jgi:hypothetical protein